MRATRAYIASAGTAAVMLGASLSMLAVVSAFVAFGSWPGAANGSHVDQLFLRAASTPKAHQVAVSANAVALARRAAARRQLALARTHATPRVHPGAGTVPAGTPVAVAPTGTPAAGGTAGPAAGPVAGANQGTQKVKQNLDATTKNVTTQVGQQVQNVQTQVNQVVDQVIGGPQTGQDGNVVGQTVQQVQDTAGSVLGH